jgi:glycopeptide antibiotics resistance protein
MKMKKNNSNGVLFLLIVYTCLVFYLMIFGFGRTTLPEYAYNLKPLATIGFYLFDTRISLQTKLINLVGNIAVFIPFGILLSLVWKGKLKQPLLVFWAGLGCLELLQLVSKKGNCDVDDFILNTIGYLIGYWLIKYGKSTGQFYNNIITIKLQFKWKQKNKTRANSLSH